MREMLHQMTVFERPTYNYTTTSCLHQLLLSTCHPMGLGGRGGSLLIGRQSANTAIWEIQYESANWQIDQVDYTPLPRPSKHAHGDDTLDAQLSRLLAFRTGGTISPFRSCSRSIYHRSPDPHTRSSPPSPNHTYNLMPPSTRTFITMEEARIYDED